jgi:hypothetical protein
MNLDPIVSAIRKYGIKSEKEVSVIISNFHRHLVIQKLILVLGYFEILHMKRERR